MGPTMPETPKFPEEFNLADHFLFARSREGAGARVAVRFGALSWTYDEVATRTRQLVHAMQTLGAPREGRVLIILPDVPPFVWSIFATLAGGWVLTMGNPDAPPADLAYLVAYTRASVVITLPRVIEAEVVQEALASAPGLVALLLVPDVATGEDSEVDVDLSLPALQTIPRSTKVRSLAAELRAATHEPAAVQTHRDDVAVWLFTSGSTGQSKAAIHTHRDFAFSAEVYAKRTVGYREGDVTVSVPRLYFGYATGTNLFFPFAVGGTTCLFAERPTPESLTAAIERHRPTILTNVPTMLGKLLEHDDTRQNKLDLGSVRFSLSAGEALPPTLLGRWNERFGPGSARGGGEVYDGIGSAEMFHIYASNRPGDVKPGSLGRVVEGYEIRILASDADAPGGPPLPPDEIGVMWVRGDSVALGYHQDRDKSWQTFHGHWCRTGDLFRVDREGYLWFAGRVDELLKVSGLWVSPIEVEECLMQHEDVAVAAVIGVADPSQEAGGEGGLLKPKAFVVLRDSARKKPPAAVVAALQEHCKARLSKHKYPRWIALVDDVPKNDRGKVDKKALKAREGVR